MKRFHLFQGTRWLFTIVVAVAVYCIGHYVTPYCRGFYWDDESINRPYVVQETFPNWTLVPIVGVPILLFAVFLAVVPRRRYLFPVNAAASCSGCMSPQRLQLWLEINQWAIIQIQALMLQLMFVETMKLYAGRLRPDFLSRLRLAGFVPIGTGIQFYCEESANNAVIEQGRLSFPSGHSSTSFGAMVPCVFFLVYHLRPWFHGCIIRLVICILPLYLAFFVAVSRTRDNRHHFADILAGSIIGVFAGIGAFWINMKYSKEKGEFDPRAQELEEGWLLSASGIAPSPQSV